MSKSRRRRQNLPAQPVTLTIERLGHDGRGIAKNNGKIAFIDGALPGEQVTAIYTSQRSQFDELRLEQVLIASDQRVSPPCEVAGLCGGCLLQHMTPHAQLSHKQQVLFDQLSHTIGISAFEILPAMTASSLAYRRKARLAVRYVHKKADVLVGFREKANTFITSMQRCEVLVPPVGELIGPLRALLLSLDGCREIPQIEVAVGETRSVPTEHLAQVLRVTLTLRHLQPLSGADMDRLRIFADHYHIEWFLQSGGPDTVKKFWPDDNNNVLHYFLPDDFGEITMAFHPGDFTQVNAQINRSMINQAISLLDLHTEDKVLDLFCGLGNFTLPIARRCGKVIGVEGSDDMVQRAGENASRNGIDNAQFFKADLFSEFATESWTGQHYDKLLLDPPRSGAIEIVGRIQEWSPQTIVYVSCNPATLARDAGELLRQGYIMTHAGVLDMFPHTGHVESMARFVRGSPASRNKQKRLN